MDIKNENRLLKIVREQQRKDDQDRLDVCGIQGLCEIPTANPDNARGSKFYSNTKELIL